MIQKTAGFFLVLFLSSGASSCVQNRYFQSDAQVKSLANQGQSAPPGYVWVRIGPQYQKSKLHEFVWGEHYRDLWAAPVLVPVLDATKVHGGLTPVEMGGGLQSTSMELRDKNGQLYALRTLDKDPSKGLSPAMRKSFVANIMRDQTSAINPYAAFILPPLASAAGIFYSNPKIYYVPQDVKGLGEFKDKFTGKVVMLEEKFKNKSGVGPTFGQAQEFLNTEELLKNTEASNAHVVNQREYAKARLFDVLIQDWDRHEGQWNWAKYPLQPDGVVPYKAVPKDRDQTFYRYTDGVIPWIITRRTLVGRIKPLIHNIPDVAGLIYNSRYLDERFLNKLTATEWQEIAQEMKAGLTDDALRKALALFPEPIYQLEGDRTYRLLQERVQKLPQLVQDFYRTLAKEAVIPGSDLRERFVVQRRDDKTTVVEAFAWPSDNEIPSRKIYSRTFLHADTDKITLFGLGGDDEFMVEGNVNKGIEVIINGGAGSDKITDRSRVKGPRRKTVVYDTQAGNILELGRETKNKTSPTNQEHVLGRED